MTLKNMIHTLYSTIHVYHIWMGINTVIAQTISVSNWSQFHQYTLKLSSFTYWLLGVIWALNQDSKALYIRSLLNTFSLPSLKLSWHVSLMMMGRKGSLSPQTFSDILSWRWWGGKVPFKLFLPPFTEAFLTC